MSPLPRAVTSTVSGLPRQFWWLWTATLVNRAGAFVLPFLAIYLANDLGYSTSFVGVVLGGYGLGAIGAALTGGVLADAFGRRPVLLVSQLSSAAMLLVLGLMTQRIAVVVLVTLFGLASNATRPAYSAMMVDVVQPADRVRAFSLHYWAVNLGFAVAAVLAGLLASSGYLLLFLVDATTTLAFAVLVYVKVPESRPGLGLRRPVTDAEQQAETLLTVLHDRVFMSFVLLVFGFAVVFMQHMSTLPVQMADDGLSPAAYGRVLALNGILIVLVTVPLTRWLQQFSRSRVLALSATIVGIGFGSTMFASTTPAYALTVVVWTIGEVIAAGIGFAVVADLSPEHMRGRYQGVFSFSFAVAALVGPIVGGAVYDAWGGAPLWLGCAAISFAAAAGHLLVAPARRRRLAQLRGEELFTGPRSVRSGPTAATSGPSH